MGHFDSTMKSLTLKLNNNDLEDEFIQEFMLALQKMGMNRTEEEGLHR